ncbi:RNB domain-containing ribonuclease [Trueperella pecoris]|uniref:RNB domain-containing ribonuclease n=1 Tax=Trueperella pecoris TaxID=2733571 RepID=UPI00210036C9|nr:RNB domain-containing ribonuclease [Trueperella pecoris]
MRQRFINPNVVPLEDVSAAIGQLAREAEVSLEYPAEAVADAEAAPREFPHLPDRRDIPLVTIDPEGSRDLDQAVYIEFSHDAVRAGSDAAPTCVVYYAIAALNMFVKPGSTLDDEVRRRATTIYLPDRSIPLHPEVLSTDAASLLPGEDRPAYLWRFELDDRGEVTTTDLELVRVRSRAQLTYTQVQAVYDGEEQLPVNVPTDLAEALARFGRLRQVLEEERGGVSLNLPEQRGARDADGFHLEFRQLTDVEGWNSQLSLMTGMEAAKIMIRANVGLLRTLPPAREKDVEQLRGVALALGLVWPAELDYPAFLRELNPAHPAALAFMNEAASLFRGAGYLALPVADGQAGDPEHGADVSLEHSAIAAPYAHVTAPLRRLVDRFGLETCRSVMTGEPMPTWVMTSLAELPALMSAGAHRASKLERDAMSLVESLTLRGREGEEFDAVVVDSLKPRKDDPAGMERGRIAIFDPALEVEAVGARVPAGTKVRVRLTNESEGPHFSVVE